MSPRTPATAASPPQLALDNQLCFGLYAASRATTRIYGPLLEPLGLTYPQYVVMLALWEHPGEATSVGGLGARLHLDTGTLTPLLKRLETMGLLTRTRDADDERRVLISLTDDGLHLRDKALDIPLKLGARMGLTLEQATALRQQLDQLVQALESGVE